MPVDTKDAKRHRLGAERLLLQIQSPRLLISSPGSGRPLRPRGGCRQRVGALLYMEGTLDGPARDGGEQPKLGGAGPDPVGEPDAL